MEVVFVGVLALVALGFGFWAAVWHLMQWLRTHEEP